MNNYAIGLNLVVLSVVYFVANVAVAFVLSLLLLVLAMKFVDSKKKF